jgi:Flp pilus assembly protein TadB
MVVTIIIIALLAALGFLLISGKDINFPITEKGGLLSYVLRQQDRADVVPTALAKRIRRQRMGPRKNFVVSSISGAKAILYDTGRGDRYERMTAMSLLLGAIGIVIAVLLRNPFMLPVLAVGFYLLPWQYVRLTGVGVRQSLTEELEMTLSAVTNSYLRSENVILAVEENLPTMIPPVSIPFERFLAEVSHVSSDVKTAIYRMKGKLKNNIYDEWLDALIACQDDRALKSQLLPIVEKLSDIRQVTAELNQIIAEPVKEFGIMVLFTFGGIVILRTMNEDWYGTLMYTYPGKITLTIILATVFISIARVINASKPPEYKR